MPEFNVRINTPTARGPQPMMEDAPHTPIHVTMNASISAAITPTDTPPLTPVLSGHLQKRNFAQYRSDNQDQPVDSNTPDCEGPDRKRMSHSQAVTHTLPSPRDLSVLQGLSQRMVDAMSHALGMCSDPVAGMNVALHQHFGFSLLGEHAELTPVVRYQAGHITVSAAYLNAFGFAPQSARDLFCAAVADGVLALLATLHEQKRILVPELDMLSTAGWVAFKASRSNLLCQLEHEQAVPDVDIFSPLCLIDAISDISPDVIAPFVVRAQEDAHANSQ